MQQVVSGFAKPSPVESALDQIEMVGVQQVNFFRIGIIKRRKTVRRSILPIEDEEKLPYQTQQIKQRRR